MGDTLESGSAIDLSCKAGRQAGMASFRRTYKNWKKSFSLAVPDTQAFFGAFWVSAIYELII
jgi:hypothetical protein